MQQTEDDFFVPELCRSEALLTMMILAELLVFVLVLADPSTAAFNWLRLALVSLFVQWNVLLSAALLCRLRPWLMRFSVPSASLLCCLVVVTLVLGCTALADYFQLGVMWRGSTESEAYVRHTLIALIMAGLVLRYFYLQSEGRRKEQAELQARIKALQARIRPHFLFNSLNSIASLIALDPVKAEHAVLDLSELFRASLAQPGTLVRWRDELELSRSYLSIERYRLGERLQVQWSVDQVPDDVPIPQLTLQPLLENAIVHGIQPLVEGGLIQVEASYQEGWFQLCVSNPCDEQQARSSGARLALSNIRARLAVLFGDRARLTVERRAGRHYAHLRYPCERLTPETTAT